jgi:AraC-like DNA-binding protein
MAIRRYGPCRRVLVLCPIVSGYRDKVDVLSDVIGATRIGRPHSNRTVRVAPWGFHGQPAPGVGFHVVLQGSCRLVREGHEPVHLGVGDVVCLLPHITDYGLADSGPGTSAVLLCGAYMLDQSRPHPLLAELPEIIHLPARVGRHPGLRAAVELLGSELDRPQHGTDAIVPALLDMLLLYILRAWYDEQADEHGPGGWVAALADRGISAALSAIHDDPARSWTVAELGALAGLSRAAFARRFAALVGQPPLSYLTWWRMTLAAHLLRDSDAPLGAVAVRTGYTSEFAFAKAFKREHGIAPGGYRRSG